VRSAGASPVVTANLPLLQTGSENRLIRGVGRPGDVDRGVAVPPTLVVEA